MNMLAKNRGVIPTAKTAARVASVPWRNVQRAAWRGLSGLECIGAMSSIVFLAADLFAWLYRDVSPLAAQQVRVRPAG
jgi:hypothetical protein